MRRLFILTLASLALTFAGAEQTKTRFNPFTGKPDFITSLSSTSLLSSTTPYPYIQNTLTPATTTQAFTVQTASVTGSATFVGMTTTTFQNATMMTFGIGSSITMSGLTASQPLKLDSSNVIVSSKTLLNTDTSGIYVASITNNSATFPGLSVLSASGTAVSPRIGFDPSQVVNPTWGTNPADPFTWTWATGGGANNDIIQFNAGAIEITQGNLTIDPQFHALSTTTVGQASLIKTNNIFQVGTSTTLAQTRSGHWEFHQSTSPTVTSCGTSAAVGVNSTDHLGTITPGTLATSCTLNFSNAWTNAPVCIGIGSGAALSLSATTTTTQATVSGLSGGTAFYYLCFGNQ